VESLLLLGIGLNPDDKSTSYREANTINDQALRDYIDKKLIAKIEFAEHVIPTKLTASACRIMTK